MRLEAQKTIELKLKVQKTLIWKGKVFTLKGKKVMRITKFADKWQTADGGLSETSIPKNFFCRSTFFSKF
jgi:hypothetical protein